MKRLFIRVKGIVQGVGFRPYVYNLASSLGLKGYVKNDSKGVIIEVEGESLESFIERLPMDAPPLSSITDIEITPLDEEGFTDFSILESSDMEGFTLLSPDISVCNDCITELFDKDNRRYLYPFINCTNCGPRYTITRSVPYDRENTTMDSFKMCPNCMDE